MVSKRRYRGTEQEQVVTVRYRGDHFLGPFEISEFVKLLISGTPHVENMGGTGYFLPTGASVGWDCEKIELRTVEVSSNSAAVSEHLQLREWVANRSRKLLSEISYVDSVEVSCGGACYATGKTYGTHFNVEFLSGKQEDAIRDLAILYVIGLPFHGNGALAFGTTIPCWSAHIEVRELTDLFRFKDLAGGSKRRLQIASTAGCSRSAFSVSLGFAWHLLTAVALERGAKYLDLPRFDNLNKAAVQYNRDLNMTVRAKTSKGRLNILDCIEQVFPKFCAIAETEDEVNACGQIEKAIDGFRSGSKDITAAHDPFVLRTLFFEHAARRGFNQDLLEHLNARLSMLGYFDLDDGGERRRIPAYLLLDQDRTACNRSVKSLLGASPPLLEKSAFEDFVTLKAEAEEIYTRWSILGDGLFDRLDSVGLIPRGTFETMRAERLPCEISDIPVRARRRGEFVAMYGHCPDKYACSWDQLLDKQQDLMLDMPEPDVVHAEWKTVEVLVPSRRRRNQLMEVFPTIDTYLRLRSQRQSGSREESRNWGSNNDSYKSQRLVGSLNIEPAFRLKNTGVPDIGTDPLGVLITREDLEPCFGIYDVHRDRGLELKNLLLSDDFVARQADTRYCDDLAEECARSVARLCQIESAILSDANARILLAMPLLKVLAPIIVEHFGIFGHLADWLAPVNQILGPLNALELMEVFNSVFEALRGTREWECPKDMGTCFAIQFTCELGDFARCEKICDIVCELPYDRISPSVLQYVGEAAFWQSLNCVNPEARQRWLETSAGTVSIILKNPSTVERRQFLMCLAMAQRANADIARYGNGGSAADLAKSELANLCGEIRSGDSALVHAQIANGLWNAGEVDRALESAKNACSGDWFISEPHRLILAGRGTNPYESRYMPKLEEHMRRWTMCVMG